MSKLNIDWRAIACILVVIGWLMYQFTVDVSAANNRIISLKDYIDDDYAEIMVSVNKIADDEKITLGKLAANEESHKNIKDRLDKLDNKLDKIYDLMVKK